MKSHQVTTTGMKKINFLLAALLLAGVSSPQKKAIAQPIAPAADGTGTKVTPQGNRYEITGGQTSRDGANLFHSFQKFGLSEGQIANFLSNPNIRNILGRVTGGDASYINGLIQVTGGSSNLFLMNPAGIVFGPNASLNVPADFTATTATGIGFGGNWFNGIGNNNWAELVGTPSEFAFGSQPGAIANLGNLTLNGGHNLTLLGGSVLNAGTLSSPGGNITVAAVPGSSTVRISQAGHLLSLDVKAGIGGFGEKGAIPYGIAALHAPLSLPELLTGSGYAHASTVTVNSDGTITLAGSGTSVDAQTGDAIASGTIDVSSPSPPLLKGGTVTVLGTRVGLSGANIDASGSNGGGVVRIGGDYQGKGTIPNAYQTFVSRDSMINVDAINSGSGGRVIVWADNTTAFYGTVTARGSSQLSSAHPCLNPCRADGGFVEVSGKENLQFSGIVDTSAPFGNAGTLLLDPKNIFIVDGATDPVVGNSLFGDNPAADATISGEALGAAIDSGNVTLQANNDIGIYDDVTVSPGITNGLTLQAGRGIEVSAKVTLNGGSFTAKINDENAIAAQRDVGAAYFQMNGGAEIRTNGGNVTISPGSFGGVTEGEVRLYGGSIYSGTGNISLTGVGSASGFYTGIAIVGSAVVEATGTGTITLNGTGANVASNDYFGIQIAGVGSRASSVDGDINLIGAGGGTGAGNYGITLQGGGAVQATGTGNITFTGTGGNGTTRNSGIVILGSNTRVSSANGTINLTGIGGGTGDENYGIYFQESVVEATGAGNITLDGTGASGVNWNAGIYLNSGSRVSAVNSDVSVTGTGGGSGTDNYGITIQQGSVVEASGIGNVTLDGTGGAGTSWNGGIFIVDSPSRVSTVNGDVSLTGRSNGTDSQNYGISIQKGGAVQATGTGNVALDGAGGIGATKNHGVWIKDTGTQVSSATGNLVIAGTGGSDGTQSVNSGISIAESAVIETTAGGNLTLNGTGGAGVSFNTGIDIQNGAAVRVADTGSITFNGTGGAGTSANDGIFLSGSPSSTISAVDGNIILNGAGAPSGATNKGINASSGIVQTTGAGTIILNGTGTGNNGFGIDLLNTSVNAAGTGTVRLQGNAMQFSGTTEIKGNGILYLEPLAANSDITVGGAIVWGTPSFNLDTETISTLQSGFSEVVIGRSDGSGKITVQGDTTFKAPVTIQAPAAGGWIDYKTGTVTGENNIPITFVADGDIILGNIVNPGGAITATTANGNINAVAGTLLNTSSTMGNGGAIALNALNGTITAANINTSTSFNSPAAAAGTVTLNSSAIALTGDINTSAAVGSGGSLVFNGSTTLNQPSITLTTSGGTASGNITFNNVLNGAAAEANALTLNAGSGNVTLNSDIGSGGKLGNLTVSAGTIQTANIAATGINFTASNTISTGNLDTSSATSNGGAIALSAPNGITLPATIDASATTGTGGSVTVTGNAFLAAPTTNIITSGSAGSGNVTFNGALNGTTANAQNLIVDAGVGNISFNGAVGSTPLGALTVNSAGLALFGSSVSASSLATNAGGTIQINGNVTATGAGGINFGDAVNLVGDITLTSDEINFATTVSGSGNVTLQSFTPSIAIAFGGGADAGAGSLDLTLAEIAAFQPGFSQIAIGQLGGTGSISIGTGGTVDLSSINANLTLNGGAVSFGSGGVVLGSDKTLTFNTGAIASGTGAVDVTIGGTNGTILFNSSGSIGAAGNPLSTAISVLNSPSVAGDVFLSNQGALTLNSSTISGQLNVTAAGAIAQAGALNVGGAAVFNAGANDITLTNPANQFGTLQLTGNNVAIAENAAADLGASNISGNFSLTAAGGITQSAPLAVGGTAIFNAGNNDITLANPFNQFGTLQLTGNNVAIAENSALDLGISTINGTLSVTSAGAITQSGALTVAGDANFTTTLPLTGDVFITNSSANGTLFDTSVVGGNLTVSSTGAISQNGAVKVAGGATFTAPGVNLSNPGNVLPKQTLSNGDVVINQVGLVTLPAQTVTGNLTVNSLASGEQFASVYNGNAIVLNLGNSFGGAVRVNTNAPALTVVTGTPGITQSGMQTVAGTATLNATSAGNITLTDAANTFGTLQLIGQNIAISENADSHLGTSTVSGDLNITSNGAITNSSPLSVSGSANFTSTLPGASISLTGANQFAGSLGFSTASGGSVAAENALPTQLGTSTIGGNFTLSSGGAISQTAPLTVSGTATLTAGANDITLNSANNFNSVAIVSGQNVSLADIDGIDLAASSIAGNLAVTAGGAIANSGNLAVAGTATFSATDIALSSSNNFSTVVVTSGNNVTVNDIDGLDLGAANISGNLNVTAAGAITQSGTLSVGGTATLNAGTADITLLDSANKISAIALIGQNAAISLGSAATLNNLAIAGNFNLTASGTISQVGTFNIGGNATINAGSSDIIFNTAINSGSLSLTGNNVDIKGAIEASSGGVTLNNSGLLNIGAGGDITAAGAFLQNGAGAVSLAGNINASSLDFFGAITLAGAVSLNSNNGKLEFYSTADGAGDLTLNVGTGSIIFNGAIGNISQLGNLTLNSTGTTRFNSTVSAASLTTDAGGTTVLNGNIATAGAQQFNDAVQLAGDVILSSNNSTLTFNNTLDGTAPGVQMLEVASGSGNITFNGALGNIIQLGAVTVNSSGTTSFNSTVNAASLTTDAGGITEIGGDISTTGTQTYNDALVLTGAVTFNTSNSDITFNNTLSGSAGSENLTLNSGSGNITANGALTSLGAVTANSTGIARFNSTVNAASLTTDAGGSTQIGGDISTTGTQTYNDALLLTGAVTFNTGNSDITFNNTLSGLTGSENLTLNSGSGNITANGALASLGTVAANSAGIARFNSTVTVNSLSTDVGGITEIKDNIAASGTISLLDAINFAGDILINSSAGDITFGSTLDGSHNLTVNAGSGNITFSGALGSTSPLTSLTATSAGSINLGGNITASGAAGIAFKGNVNLIGNSTLDTRAGNGSINFGGQVDGARLLTLSAGTGDVTFDAAVGSLTPLSGLNIDAQNISAASTIAVGAAGITFNAGETINLNGALTADSGGSVNLTATGNLNASDIAAVGGITLTSTGGDVRAGNLDASNTAGAGGKITLTSNTGEIATGNLNSSGATDGGEIFVNARTQITAGEINSSGSAGAGGNVTLDPIGDIQVTWINSQGATTGGFVDITAGQFFRATGTFTAADGSIASISSIGNSGGGTVTIRHGGNGITPFIVGDGTLNGTAGAIVSTNNAIASGEYLYTFTQGNISIVSVPEPPPVPTTLAPDTEPPAPQQLVQPPAPQQLVQPPAPQQLVEAPAPQQFVEAPVPAPVSQQPAEQQTAQQPAVSLPLEEIIAIAREAEIAVQAPSAEQPSQQQTLDYSEFDKEILPPLENPGFASRDLIMALEPGVSNFWTIVKTYAAKAEDGDIETTSSKIAAKNQADGQSATNTTAGAGSSAGDASSENGSASPSTRSAAAIDRVFEGAADIQGSVWQIEQYRNQEFEQYLGVKANLAEQGIAVSSFQKVLQTMEEETGKKSAILYVIARASQLDLILVPSVGNPIHHSVPSAPKDALMAVVKDFRSRITDPRHRYDRSYLASAQQLYQWMIAPLEKDLEKLEIDTLLFSMDAGLRSLPIAALHDGQQFLVEKYSYSLIPSFSLTDWRYQSLKQEQVLAFGASEFVEQTPLPAVPVELAAIASIRSQKAIVPALDSTLDEEKFFLNQEFTLENLKSQRSAHSFRIIHLATHAEFQPGVPGNSYIELWNDRLHLDELRQLKWDSPQVGLVVLSACRTALGDEQAELGFAGLAVYSGAKSALASLWYISDVGTLALMREFYANLGAASIKAEALRQAQIAMIRGQIHLENGQLVGSGGTVSLPPEIPGADNIPLSHPYYWSAFTAIGSPW